MSCAKGGGGRWSRAPSVPDAVTAEVIDRAARSTHTGMGGGGMPGTGRGKRADKAPLTEVIKNIAGETTAHAAITSAVCVARYCEVGMALISARCEARRAETAAAAVDASELAGRPLLGSDDIAAATCAPDARAG